MHLIILYNRFGNEIERNNYGTYSGWPKAYFSINNKIITLTYFINNKREIRAHFYTHEFNFHKIYCGHYTNTTVIKPITKDGKYFIFRELVIKSNK